MASEELLFIAGDRAAFEAVFRAHYGPLCGFAVGYLKDLEKAEDLVQDLFVRLWEERERLTIQTSLKSYLYTSVRNRSLNALRAVKHSRPLMDEQDDLEEQVVRTEEEYEERSNRIQKAIDGLPPERGRVFRMSRNEGLKYHEIAESLGISVKTVENQMGKALKTLRLELADLLPTALVLWSMWKWMLE